jgi:hypothetical protein
MPKKRIPVLPEDLRRNDVIVEVGYRIPVLVNGRNLYTESAISNRVDAHAGYKNGFLVERVVDERIHAKAVVEAGAVPQTIENLILDYQHKNGDPKRMKITTGEPYESYMKDRVEIRLEGWIR